MVLKLFLIGIVVSCSNGICSGIKRQKIDALTWRYDQLPDEVCKAFPVLVQYGAYRVLNNGLDEVVSYCKPQIKDFFGMPSKDYNNLLDSTVGK